MKALILEKKGKLSLRDIESPSHLNPQDVKIKINTVGICGSDAHYYTHGKIGSFVVKEPMVLGHEASGDIVAVGSEVQNLKVGDRVCMEPGVPNPNSKESRLGLYNIDPAVRFWATPPIDGCLTKEVVHPAAYTYRLPKEISYAEGAMIEPFAVGMQAVIKAQIKPGDTACILGAGTIGMMVALAALAAGCSRIIISDMSSSKLNIIGKYDGIETVNLNETSMKKATLEKTSNWGADVVFECSGSAPALLEMSELVRPGGVAVLVGMPINPVPIDIVALQSREIRIETVFRYANIYDRAISLIASGKVDLKPLISATFSFEDSISAFERAAEHLPADVKIQIHIS